MRRNLDEVRPHRLQKPRNAWAPMEYVRSGLASGSRSAVIRHLELSEGEVHEVPAKQATDECVVQISRADFESAAVEIHLFDQSRSVGDTTSSISANASPMNFGAKMALFVNIPRFK